MGKKMDKKKLGRSFDSIVKDDSGISHKKIYERFSSPKSSDKKAAVKRKIPSAEIAEKEGSFNTYLQERKRRVEKASLKRPGPQPVSSQSWKKKIFSDYYSVIQKQENLLDVLKIIDFNRFEIKSILEKHVIKDFNSWHNTFLRDETKEKKGFNKILKEETKSGIDLLKELNNALEEKQSRGKVAHNNLLKEKVEIYTVWSELAEEKEWLQNENKRMTSELDEFLKKKNWLVSKREYIHYKYSEYGDENKIIELYEQWSKEYDDTKAEEKSLKAEYDKGMQEEKTIPRLWKDIKKEIKSRREEIDMAKYEVHEILKIFPDIEELANESNEIVTKYRATHNDLEESSKILNNLSDKFKQTDAEYKELEKTLYSKKEELAPFVESENSLKNELTEVTNRFNRQEELKEQKSTLNSVLQPLEKSIEEWKNKIKNHEIKSAEMKKETETLKGESQKITSDLKEYESLVGPVKELKERLDNAEKEIPVIVEQDKKLTDEIHNLRKENEILSIKAKQFEMVKKKLEGIK